MTRDEILARAIREVGTGAAAKVIEMYDAAEVFKIGDEVVLPDEGDARYEVAGFRPGQIKVRSLRWGTGKWVADTYPVLNLVVEARR